MNEEKVLVELTGNDFIDAYKEVEKLKAKVKKLKKRNAKG